MGVAQQACEMRAGVVVVLANALCEIWCGRVFYFQRDWLWTSGGQSMLRPTF